MRRSALGQAGALAFVLSAGYVCLGGLGFVGAGLTGSRSLSSEMKGYRLDRMLEATDGD